MTTVSIPIACTITVSIPITIASTITVVAAIVATTIASRVSRSKGGGSSRWLVCGGIRLRLWQALIKCIVPVVSPVTLGLGLVVVRGVARYTAILSRTPIVATGGTGDILWRRRGISNSPAGQATLFILPPLLVE